MSTTILSRQIPRNSLKNKTKGENSPFRPSFFIKKSSDFSGIIALFLFIAAPSHNTANPYHPTKTVATQGSFRYTAQPVKKINPINATKPKIIPNRNKRFLLFESL